MDPVSITTTVICLSAQCLGTVKKLYSLREKYKNAEKTISAIYTQTTVLSASLGHIQTLVLRHAESFNAELKSTLDTSLTGCLTVYSVLEEEIQKLNQNPGSVKTGLVYVWQEDTMNDLLQQIRGQRDALSLLMKVLELDSVADIRAMLRKNNAVLESLMQRTSSLRKAHPKIKSPPSIFEGGFDDSSSIASSTAFAFDDTIVNSWVYRRTLAMTMNGARTTNKPVNAETDSKALNEAEATSNNELEEMTKKYLNSQTRLAECEMRMNEWIDHAHHLERKYNETEKGLKEEYLAKVKVEERVTELLNRKAKLDNSIDRLQTKHDELVVASELQQAEIAALRNSAGLTDVRMSEMESVEKASQSYFKKLRGDIDNLSASYKKASEMKEKEITKKLALLQQEHVATITEMSNEHEREIIRRDQHWEMEIQRVLDERHRDREAEDAKLANLMGDMDRLKLQLREKEKEVMMKDEDLQRYRAFDPIIQSIRSLSPEIAQSPKPQSAPKS